MNIYLCTLISTQSTHTNGKQSLFMPWGGGGVGWGGSHVFRGNGRRVHSSSKEYIKGGLYKIDCQLTANKGGRGGGEGSEANEYYRASCGIK